MIADHKFNYPLSITNSFGVPSADPKFWEKDISNLIKNTRKGQIVISAFQGTLSKDVDSYINDFVETARLLKNAGSKIFEVNFSCPNEGTEDLLCFDVDRSLIIVKAIKNEIVKFTIDN